MKNFNIISQDFLNILNTLDISYNLKKTNNKLWSDICSDLYYTPVDYTNCSIDYQICYYDKKKYLDFSIIIIHNKLPVAIWPLCIDENLKIASLGRNLMEPIFLHYISINLKKNYLKKIIESLFLLKKKYKNIIINFEKNFFNEDITFVSNIEKTLIKNTSKLSYQYISYLKLSSNKDSIKSYFRKSFKSLVDKKKSKFKYLILDNEDDKTWISFRNLHKKVAGKITRSSSTWNNQFQAIKNKNGFLVYALDNNIMIGGGFFQYSKDEAIYGTGAYLENYKKFSIGHIIQFEAIKYMTQKKLKWYKLGVYYANDSLVDKKSKNISHFLSGFSSHLFKKNMYEF